MSESRTARELASRLEIDFHRRGSRFRRATWWTALILGSLTAAWLVYAGQRGEQWIYEAGPVSTSHRMFENECAQCHVEWRLWDRMTSLSAAVRSVDNQQCQQCHQGSSHHENQVPAHGDMSCAECHVEHRAHQQLAQVADHHCTGCHADLKTRDGTPPHFAAQVERFSETGHPEFAVHRLLKQETAGVGSEHGVWQLLGNVARDSQDRLVDDDDDAHPAKWQDKARIRFNHAKHLHVEYDADGKLVHGLIGTDGALRDLSRNCDRCHQPDVSGRYMEPINYSRHCAECHPLLFDNDFPGETVPHETPAVVRGFLVDRYTREAAKSGGDGQLRPRLLNRPYSRTLTDAEANARIENVRAAEEAAQSHRLRQFDKWPEHTQFGDEAQGGCRFCHTLKTPLGGGIWEIQEPAIPRTWLVHSRFRHEGHRMLGCVACHENVTKSESTGDVLLPTIDACRTCHTSRPPASGGLSRSSGARTNCVECHVYHSRDERNFDGRLGADLKPLASTGSSTRKSK